MIDEFEAAIYQALLAEHEEGGRLAGIPQILDTDMLELSGGSGITLQGGEETYQGGSENRRDFATVRVEINHVVKLLKSEYREAKVQAGAWARLTRATLKANNTLSGFLVRPLRIESLRVGFGQIGGAWVAIATLTVAGSCRQVTEE